MQDLSFISQVEYKENHDVNYCKEALLYTAAAEADHKLDLDALKVMIGYTKGQIDPVYSYRKKRNIH